MESIVFSDTQPPTTTALSVIAAMLWITSKLVIATNESTVFTVWLQGQFFVKWSERTGNPKYRILSLFVVDSGVSHIAFA